MQWLAEKDGRLVVPKSQRWQTFLDVFQATGPVGKTLYACITHHLTQEQAAARGSGAQIRC